MPKYVDVGKRKMVIERIDVGELKMVIERIASRSGIQSSHSPLFRVWERDPSEIFCARKKPLPCSISSKTEG